MTCTKLRTPFPVFTLYHTLPENGISQILIQGLADSAQHSIIHVFSVFTEEH